jgi:hypothetical protein
MYTSSQQVLWRALGVLLVVGSVGGCGEAVEPTATRAGTPRFGAAPSEAYVTILSPNATRYTDRIVAPVKVVCPAGQRAVVSGRLVLENGVASDVSSLHLECGTGTATGQLEWYFDCGFCDHMEGNGETTYTPYEPGGGEGGGRRRESWSSLLKIRDP